MYLYIEHEQFQIHICGPIWIGLHKGCKYCFTPHPPKNCPSSNQFCDASKPTCCHMSPYSASSSLVPPIHAEVQRNVLAPGSLLNKLHYHQKRDNLHISDRNKKTSLLHSIGGKWSCKNDL